MSGRHAALDPSDVEQTCLEVYLIPSECYEFPDSQAVGALAS
jgi:hypothetical protein